MKKLLSILLLACCAWAADYKAGVARINITPTTPIWMTGYGNRSHPSEGVFQDIWVKALAIEDSKHYRVVIVTSDLIGLPGQMTDLVSARIQKQYGLSRSQLLFNSSHTHTGPLVKGNLEMMFELDPENRRVVDEYGAKLTENLVSVIGAALGKLAPAKLDFGQGEAGFAANRRQFATQKVRIGVNPAGPTDHSVPVLRVTAPDGSLVAVLFGYACHNTTLTGQFYKISGDYAGFAQAEFEKAHPGVTAMFAISCGADQNPNPRSELELAQKHGRELAEAVNKVLGQKLTPVKGSIRSAFQIVEPNLRPHTREMFEAQINDPMPVRVRLAKAMLKAYDEGHPVRRVPYPVQALRFGKSLTVVALGGEIVVDYCLRIKREYPNEPIFVAGYSNDVMCYIPSKRVVKEGGYEVVDSMMYYCQPAPFTEEVEETVMGGVHQVMARVGRTAKP